jgi:hypothetical protein
VNPSRWCPSCERNVVPVRGRIELALLGVTAASTMALGEFLAMVLGHGRGAAQVSGLVALGIWVLFTLVVKPERWLGLRLRCPRCGLRELESRHGSSTGHKSSR